MEGLLEFGYLGLFLGAFLAATVVPFSSDVLLVGILALGGSPVMTVVMASLGNWTGGLTTYWLGRLGKWEWIERWFKVTREKLEAQKAKVDKWGSLLSFLTWLPVVGDLMAIALGFYKVHFGRTALFMAIGKSLRFIMWALLYEAIWPVNSALPL